MDTGQFNPKGFTFPYGRRENFFCVSVLPFLKKTGEREMANYASLSHCPSKSPAAQGEKEFAPPAYSRRREKDIFRTQQNGSRAYACNVSLGLTRTPPLFFLPSSPPSKCRYFHLRPSLSSLCSASEKRKRGKERRDDATKIRGEVESSISGMASKVTACPSTSLTCRKTKCNAFYLDHTLKKTRCSCRVFLLF